MYKTILVPVDLAQAEKAEVMIDVARKLADKGGRIVITHVVENLPGYIAAQMPGGFIETAKQEAHEQLEEIKQAAGLDAEVVVRSDHPAMGILAVADEAGADLVIIASHRPGMQDYLLGSTAARVVRHARCSVLVVR